MPFQSTRGFNTVGEFCLKLQFIACAVQARISNSCSKCITRSGIETPDEVELSFLMNNDAHSNIDLERKLNDHQTTEHARNLTESTTEKENIANSLDAAPYEEKLHKMGVATYTSGFWGDLKVNARQTALKARQRCHEVCSTYSPPRRSGVKGVSVAPSQPKTGSLNYHSLESYSPVNPLKKNAKKLDGAATEAEFKGDDAHGVFLKNTKKKVSIGSLSVTKNPLIHKTMHDEIIKEPPLGLVVKSSPTLSARTTVEVSTNTLKEVGDGLLPPSSLGESELPPHCSVTADRPRNTIENDMEKLMMSDIGSYSQLISSTSGDYEESYSYEDDRGEFDADDCIDKEYEYVDEGVEDFNDMQYYCQVLGIEVEAPSEVAFEEIQEAYQHLSHREIENTKTLIKINEAFEYLQTYFNAY